MRRAIPLLVLLCLLMGGCEPTERADLAIRGVTIVDVTDGSLVSDQTVLLRGNRIVAVGSTDATTVPEQADVVDGGGGYLVPGLWDVHVHSAVSFDWHFPLFIAHGVTSVRNMHTSVDTALELTNAVRRRVTAGEVGPRFYANGPILDGDPPIQPGSVSAADPARGRTLVDSLHAAGADFIKIYDNVSRDTYDAVLAQARARGIPVDGHLPKMVTPEVAAAAGQRTIEHVLSLAFECSAVSDSLRAEYSGFVQRWPTLEFPENLITYFGLERTARETRHPAACRTTAEHLAEGGVAVTPTLFIEWLEPAGIVADSARMALLPATVREQWRQQALEPDFIGSILRPVLDATAATVRDLDEADVTLLAGTDVGNAFLVPGISLHEELRYLVEMGGLSPLAALQAATLNPSRVLGLSDSLGTVEPGKLADLVLLDANPLVDISNTHRIRAVVADGRLFRRADLDRLLVAPAAGGR